MRTFEHFALMTVGAQRQLFLLRLRRSYLKSLDKLKDEYEKDLVKAQELEIKAHMLDAAITQLEDQVADRADKEYGDDRVWRVSKTLLRKVAKRMDKASQELRNKQERWRKEAKALRHPFNREVNALLRLYKAAALSAQST